MEKKGQNRSKVTLQTKREGGGGGGKWGVRGKRGTGKKGKASQNISNYAQFLIPLHPQPSLFILQVIL